MVSQKNINMILQRKKLFFKDQVNKQLTINEHLCSKIFYSYLFQLLKIYNITG